MNIQVGDVVIKDSGDYTFSGIVVSVFPKLSGQTRIVVEDDRGLLFIFNPTQLRLVDGGPRIRTTSRYPGQPKGLGSVSGDG